MEKTIKELMANYLSIDIDELENKTTFDSLGLDSLDYIEMLMHLEDQLNIQINEEVGFVTIKDLINYCKDNS